MRHVLQAISKFSFTLTLLGGFAGSSVSAQNQTEMADACIQAAEAGDLETATELATLMMDWKHLFNITTIKKAEQCLQTVTGKYWKYFTTKSRFLSGDEARAEQAFIDGAGERRAAQEESLKRLRCEVTVADFDVSKLEAEYEIIKKARTLEALQATLNACTQVYKTDQNTALLNPVCHDIFKSIGIPSTEYAFDNQQLEMARLKLAVSRINLSKVGNGNAKLNFTMTAKVKECRELLTE